MTGHVIVPYNLTHFGPYSLVLILPLYLPFAHNIREVKWIARKDPHMRRIGLLYSSLFHQSPYLYYHFKHLRDQFDEGTHVCNKRSPPYLYIPRTYELKQSTGKVMITVLQSVQSTPTYFKFRSGNVKPHEICR